MVAVSKERLSRMPGLDVYWNKAGRDRRSGSDKIDDTSPPPRFRDGGLVFDFVLRGVQIGCGLQGAG